MDRCSAWVSARPVTAFFVAAYLISWPLFLVVLFLVPPNSPVGAPLGTLAVFSPALAAMLVAHTVEPERIPVRRVLQRISFGAGWVLAWGTLVVFIVRVRHIPFQPALAVFAGCLALLPAFTVSRALSRTAGVRRHFRSLIAPRGNAVWYFVAIGLCPAVQLAGAAISRSLGFPGIGPSTALAAVDPIDAMLLFLYGFLFAGGVNEESGWRGFALPRLQRRRSPLVAAIILWVMWALWHLPADFASGSPMSSILVNRLFFNAMWSVLFIWLFNRTAGSLLAPALFHPAMNTSGDLLPRTDAATALFVVLVIVVVVTDRMWRRLPADHPALLSGAGPGAHSDHTDGGRTDLS